MAVLIDNKETRFTINHVAGGVTYHGNLVLDVNNVIVEGSINADFTIDDKVTRIATMVIQNANPAQFGTTPMNSNAMEVQVLKRVQEMKTGSLVSCTAVFEMMLDDVRTQTTNNV